MELTYAEKYKLSANLIERGYLVHCTNAVFDTFDSSSIKGGCRAREGYGFYFSDMPYKPIEYGSNFKVVKKDDFVFLDTNTPLTQLDFLDIEEIRVKIMRLENKMYSVRNNTEYDEIQNEIDSLREKYDYLYDEGLYKAINDAIVRYDVKTVGELEYYINNPNLMVPKLIRLYVTHGYDGYYTDGIYTIFNFEKLNKYLINIDTSNLNLNESIDISSLKTQKTLHPDFWKNETLDSRVRLKLLDIADDFIDYLKVDWVKPKDITMTGSLANYNWSKKYSDIDLHIIYDFKKIDKKIDFVKNYLDAKKDLWNQKHQDISIYGFPVEVYVQNESEPHASSGVYSLENNKWLIKPEYKTPSKQKISAVSKNAKKWADKIDKILDNAYLNSTESQKEKSIKKLDKTFNDIKNIRKKGFEKGGDEMSQNNLVFKLLRRNGYIDKIINKKNDIYDDIMSIEDK